MNTNEIFDSWADGYMDSMGNRVRAVPEECIDGFVSDILNSQWQTREPTREDGDYIIVECVSHFDRLYHEVIRRTKFIKNKHRRFMRIPQ